MQSSVLLEHLASLEYFASTLQNLSELPALEGREVEIVLVRAVGTSESLEVAK